jgi:hypothetical protein
MEVWVSQLSDEEIFREIGKIIQDLDMKAMGKEFDHENLLSKL